MFQEYLFQKIQQQLNGKTSLNEAIADVLDISYDAAHRRTSAKSKLSLEESVILAHHFGISLDQLFEVKSQNYVTVQKTQLISNEKELEDYYLDSYHSLVPLLSIKNCTTLYSAKDIPIFYTAKNEVLSKFKAYVWLKILDPKFKNISYENYHPKKSLLKAAKQLGELYSNLNTTEIWDITTINSLLKQVHFYFTAQQLSMQAALEINNTLKKLIYQLEKKLQMDNPNFQLYYNELLLMNNNVLVSTPFSKSLYVPFTILCYYKTNDIITCNEAKDFLEKQLLNSKLLNTAGEKEQKTFFNKIYKKIDSLNQLIIATKELDFQ